MSGSIALIFGIINCTYDIEEKESILLSEEFQKEIDLDIFIDNEKIKYSKEYIFSSLGIHIIEYKLYEQKINMDYMFKNVTSLINVEMISEKQIFIESMIGTFENCINLNNFESNNFNTSLVNSFHKLFYNTILTSFKINNYFDTYNAIDMSYMFSGTSLLSLDLSFSKLDNAQNLSNIFSNCHSLLEVNTKNINTTNVKDLSFMFYNCESLTDLNLSSFDTSKAINMSNMFKECISLEIIDISLFRTEKVEDMSNMFENCNSLQNLNINFDTNNVKTMSNMFHFCSSLTELNLSSFNTFNLKDISPYHLYI